MLKIKPLTQRLNIEKIARNPFKGFQKPLTERLDIEEIARNSFKDFHQKGVDYICLRRSPDQTVKLYFFDGDFAKMPEVVSPHDHRYDFITMVCFGRSQNVWFREHSQGEVYSAFDYRTPLNGGDGFTYQGEVRLKECKRETYKRGECYQMDAHELHTIRILANETVLMLVQYEDVVPLDNPTRTFTQGQMPSLDGLYNRFTHDQIVNHLRRFEERTGHILTQNFGQGFGVR